MKEWMFLLMESCGINTKYEGYSENIQALILDFPFPGAKARLGRNADHSPPSSAEIKNE
jgi:hypothetical protein